ncbi:hypothetical protein IAU60_006850 [Kwoniella sp. DSM 27419]
MLPSAALVLLLPLLAHAAPSGHCPSRSSSDIQSASTPIGDALVATQGYTRTGNPWAQPTRSSDGSDDGDNSDEGDDDDDGEDDGDNADDNEDGEGSDNGDEEDQDADEGDSGDGDDNHNDDNDDDDAGDDNDGDDAGYSTAAPPQSTSAVSARGSKTKLSSVQPTSTSTPTGGDCKCGYKLSKYNDAYFPQAIVIDFSKMKDLSELANYGIEINDQYHMGAVSDKDGTYAVGSGKNVKLNNGVLEFWVPGGQVANGGAITGAEIMTIKPYLGGIVSMDAKLDPGHGTVQSIFTYTIDEGVGRSEQDIEMLGQSFMKASDIADAGIQLTNWDPKWSGTDFKITPFPANPTTDYHKYTIGWMPKKTTYYFDDKAIDGPSKFRSVDPSQVVINHWTNGDPGFTEGPPKKDLVMKVKSLAFYLQEESLDHYPALPNGCSLEQACRV